MHYQQIAHDDFQRFEIESDGTSDNMSVLQQGLGAIVKSAEVVRMMNVHSTLFSKGGTPKSK